MRIIVKASKHKYEKYLENVKKSQEKQPVRWRIQK